MNTATALEQSLMLVRIDPADGTELDRQPIAPHVTDFGEDNFPDHCVLWNEGRVGIRLYLKWSLTWPALEVPDCSQRDRRVHETIM
jgi:hypothetical protein